MAGPTLIVAIDANVLINFIHIEQLDSLAQIPGLSAVIPAEVAAEVSDPDQATVLRAALGSGALSQVEVSGTQELTAYADYTRRLGKGESACLAIASARGWSVASDEKRLFRRTAIDVVGEERLFTTPGLILQLIRADVITVADADGWKVRLAERRFIMRFDSFSEFF